MMAEGGLAENINLEIIKVHGPEWILKEIEGE